MEHAARTQTVVKNLDVIISISKIFKSVSILYRIIYLITFTYIFRHLLISAEPSHHTITLYYKLIREQQELSF